MPRRHYAVTHPIIIAILAHFMCSFVVYMQLCRGFCPPFFFFFLGESSFSNELIRAYLEPR